MRRRQDIQHAAGIVDTAGHIVIAPPEAPKADAIVVSCHSQTQRLSDVEAPLGHERSLFLAVPRRALTQRHAYSMCI